MDVMPHKYTLDGISVVSIARVRFLSRCPARKIPVSMPVFLVAMVGGDCNDIVGDNANR